MQSFEDFHGLISAEEKIIVDILRNLVLELEPNFVEKISYGVPYYFLHSRVCFIWPASVKWGPKEGVLFGFCKGAHIDDFQKVLDTTGRKEIGTLTFLGPEEIDEKQIKELLIQAIVLDKSIQDQSKRRKRRTLQ